MIEISRDNADDYQAGWQKLQWADIIASFEVFDEGKKQYNRITGIDFGSISKGFIKHLNDLNPDNKDTLSICMGIDKNSNKTQLFWDFKINGENFYYEGDSNMLKTFVGHTKNPLKPHLGVSVDYKNEVCTNWASLPFYAMSDIFFVIQDLPDEVVNGKELFRSTPVKVLKFIVTEQDIKILKEKVTKDKHLKIHYGANLGNGSRYIVDFIPVIQVYTPQMSAVFEEDDEDSTYADFVGACPPTCPD